MINMLRGLMKKVDNVQEKTNEKSNKELKVNSRYKKHFNRNEEFDGFISRLDTHEERLSLKNKSIEAANIEIQREKE